MPRFKVRFSAYTIRKRYASTQIFIDMEKKISVFENTRIRVDGQMRFKNATCGRSFLNMEEKTKFSTGYVWAWPKSTRMA